MVFPDDIIPLQNNLEKYLKEKFYRHYRVVRMANKARRFINDLFCVYTKDEEDKGYFQLPDECRRRVETDGVEQVVCDYIAGMTDRYALDEYKKFFYPYERV